MYNKEVEAHHLKCKQKCKHLKYVKNQRRESIIARTSKKTVYQRIEDKKEDILKTEEQLKILNEELQDLNKEKDELEMRQLFEQMRTNGVEFSKAMALLNGHQEEVKEEIKKPRIKKDNKQENEQISLPIEE